MESPHSDEIPPVDGLLDAVNRTKRRAVPAACQQCRQRKVKCDGLRPCSGCNRRSLSCVFDARENETPREASKRKYDELQHSYDDLCRLFDAMATEDEPKAMNLHAQFSDTETPFNRVYDQRLRQNFLVSLLQSTGSLQDVVNTASTAFNQQTRVVLPDGDAYKPLRDCIITLEALSGVLENIDGTQHLIESGELRDYRESSETFSYGPIHWVSATPWTDLPCSDYGVSHLISLYFAFLNPYWRFVEEDLDLDTDYCSPLLVNAVLAFTSLFSGIDDAFVTKGNLLTRGEHFHNEAVSLWGMEHGRTSMTNIQALMILSYEFAYRGIDKLGATLIVSALSLYTFLPIPTLTHLSTKAAKRYDRDRKCLAWTVVYWHKQAALNHPYSKMCTANRP
ncbi:hypothetical protein K431DRAFT_321677 [Polychaeton citri CBS 116435]|uniref:Zn(2)-C6 fungal-type domain-containing protein n=1 Tax=Polychaeton citri CBS 116435 TaxID=1314669 RepID=A0A9P4UKX1_9PEZI|nr:hypothetical protein K431DRAFT_321677 [Polychaeton citri CBS 116435]